LGNILSNAKVRNNKSIESKIIIPLLSLLFNLLNLTTVDTITTHIPIKIKYNSFIFIKVHKKFSSKVQQKMASSCLELPPPVSGNRRKTDPYLSKVMFCLIQNYKQEITNIEKQLAS